MNMLTLGAAGIAAVLLAVWMKGVKAEYGIFVVIAAQLFSFFMVQGGWERSWIQSGSWSST